MFRRKDYITPFPYYMLFYKKFLCFLSFPNSVSNEKITIKTTIEMGQKEKQIYANTMLEKKF